MGGAVGVGGWVSGGRGLGWGGPGPSGAGARPALPCDICLLPAAISAGGLTSKPLGADSSAPPFLPFFALGTAPGISPSRESITIYTLPVAAEGPKEQQTWDEGSPSDEHAPCLHVCLQLPTLTHRPM